MAVILIDSCIVIDLTAPQSRWFEWSVTPAGKLKLNQVLETARGQVRVLFELGFAEVRVVR